MKIASNRTGAYRFTVDLSSDEDMKLVELLREAHRNRNIGRRARGETPKYVKLQGRGPRLGMRRYHQSLPLSLAQTADVYVYDRYEWNT